MSDPKQVNSADSDTILRHFAVLKSHWMFSVLKAGWTAVILWLLFLVMILKINELAFLAFISCIFLVALLIVEGVSVKMKMQAGFLLSLIIIIDGQEVHRVLTVLREFHEFSDDMYLSKIEDRNIIILSENLERFLYNECKLTNIRINILSKIRNVKISEIILEFHSWNDGIPAFIQRVNENEEGAGENDLQKEKEEGSEGIHQDR